MSEINIFIAYARKDKEFLDEFLTYLKVLSHAAIPVKIWCDREIDAGKEWKKEIETALEKADVFLLLVSQYFTASDFCMSIEMKRAIERHQDGTAKVVPIVLRKCNWHLTVLSKLQAPVEGKPIKGNEAIEDELYTGIVDEVHSVTQEIVNQRELKRLQAQEDQYWKQVAQTHRIQSYREYLELYPNGKKRATAKINIQAIEATQEQDRLKQLQKEEDAFWEKTKATATIAAYDQYLKKYANGKYASAALSARQLLQQKALDAARAKDHAAWKTAADSKTKESYQNYLAQYPDGLHQAEAQTALMRLNILLPEMIFVEGSSNYNGRAIKDFWIGQYPVTNEEYACFLNIYKSDTVKAGEYKGQTMIEAHAWGVQQENQQWQAAKGYERHPVICVSWYGANEYCNWLKTTTGENYQLPNEWYWEWAARGGKKSKNYEYAGSNNLNEVGWYKKNSGGKTHQVGELNRNELGLYDMSGNVWEWCENWYDASTNTRAVRGGSWNYFANYCRSSFRYWNDPFYTVYNIGFRVVRC